VPEAFLAKRCLVDAPLDSTAGVRPSFRTTQWGLLAAASVGGDVEACAAFEELYRLYSYPVYAFVRRRGHGSQDAQDLTQDFFVHLLKKGALGRADPQRGRFRNFQLGALEHFLADAAKRAGAGKRGGGCHWVFLDDDKAEDRFGQFRGLATIRDAWDSDLALGERSAPSGRLLYTSRPLSLLWGNVRLVSRKRCLVPSKPGGGALTSKRAK
jgi:hypothetical protein